MPCYRELGGQGITDPEGLCSRHLREPVPPPIAGAIWSVVVEKLHAPRLEVRKFPKPAPRTVVCQSRYRMLFDGESHLNKPEWL